MRSQQIRIFQQFERRGFLFRAELDFLFFRLRALFGSARLAALRAAETRGPDPFGSLLPSPPALPPPACMNAARCRSDIQIERIDMEARRRAIASRFTFRMSLAQIFREAPNPIAAVALRDRDLVAFDLDRHVDDRSADAGGTAGSAAKEGTSGIFSLAACGCSDSGTVSISTASFTATDGALPLPSHSTLFSSTPRLLAAGFTLQPYSFASIPFGNSTR